GGRGLVFQKGSFGIFIKGEMKMFVVSLWLYINPLPLKFTVNKMKVY
ncbi:hypothetical protein KKC_07112, partial [Listeria fleischmannii subsp. coloradonensis]